MAGQKGSGFWAGLLGEKKSDVDPRSKQTVADPDVISDEEDSLPPVPRQPVQRQRPKEMTPTDPHKGSRDGGAFEETATDEAPPLEQAPTNGALTRCLQEATQVAAAIEAVRDTTKTLKGVPAAGFPTVEASADMVAKSIEDLSLVLLQFILAAPSLHGPILERLQKVEETVSKVVSVSASAPLDPTLASTFDPTDVARAIVRNQDATELLDRFLSEAPPQVRRNGLIRLVSVGGLDVVGGLLRDESSSRRVLGLMAFEALDDRESIQKLERDVIALLERSERPHAIAALSAKGTVISLEFAVNAFGVDRTGDGSADLAAAAVEILRRDQEAQHLFCSLILTMEPPVDVFVAPMARLEPKQPLLEAFFEAAVQSKSGPDKVLSALRSVGLDTAFESFFFAVAQTWGDTPKGALLKKVYGRIIQA